jgi:hypothetical protein
VSKLPRDDQVAIPAMTVRWWVKFGGIKTSDPEFARARRAAIIVGGVSVLALVSAIPSFIRK